MAISKGTILILLVSAASFHAQVITVFDGRNEHQAVAPTVADIALIRRSALPRARIAWRSDEYCTEHFEPVAATTGTFTAPGRTQTALLYRYCVKGHDIANNGIAIIDTGRIVAHVVYSGGEESSIHNLPDLDGDSLNELLTAGGTSHQGYYGGYINIVGLTSQGAKFHGVGQTNTDDCGAKPENCKTLAYVIGATPGHALTWYRETFRQNKARRWLRTGNRVGYQLTKPVGTYQFLR